MTFLKWLLEKLYKITLVAKIQIHHLPRTKQLSWKSQNYTPTRVGNFFLGKNKKKKKN